MAEEPSPGMGVSDWLRTLAAGYFGGLPGLATSPAANPIWERGGAALGMEGGQAKSLAGLLFAALSGGGLFPLAMAGWGAAKKFSTPTEARWWNTPASPYGADYGRSELQGQEMGGPKYLAQPWGPQYGSPVSGGHSRSDVRVGPGTGYAVGSMVGSAENDFFSGRFGNRRAMMQDFQENRSPPQAGPGRGFGAGPVPTGQFAATRELLGMPLTPDFNAIRAMLGLGE